MLYLEAPFLSVDGVAVFGDHADPLQWYYMPGAPRIATVAGAPQLSLIRFRGEAGTGGFLNVDVDLAVDADLLAEVARQVKAKAQLDEPPRLAPLPVIDGTVRMMLFDAESPVPAPPGGPGTGAGTGGPAPGGGAAAPTDPDALRFVLALSHPARPALYADNRAAFSVRLTQEGITTLEKAMRGEMAPIGIVYGLDFLGLRPAYHVSVDVDWDLVQKHLEEHEEFKLPLIYSSSIDTFVDKLVESRVIDILADTFLLEDDGSPVLARRDQAIDDIRDMITETFFKPSLDPMARGDGVDTGVRTFGRIAQAVLSGGASEVHAFQRREVEATRIERKRLNVSMSERTTVKRTIYPQGHLGGMLRLLGPGADLTPFVIDVDLDDPWFERRQLKVLSRAAWQVDGVRSVEVVADYGGDVESALLTAADPDDDLSWGSRLVDGGMARDVQVHYRVHFEGVDTRERPGTLEAPARTVVGDAVEIDPRELYSVVPVPVVSLQYPFDAYPLVEVDFEYADPDNQVAQADTVRLTAEATEGSWPMFVRDAAAGPARCRVTHRAANQRDVVGEWGDLEGDQVLVRDPFPNVRALDVVSGLDWAVTQRAFVDVVYVDEAHGVREEMSCEFTKDAEVTEVFRVRLADPQLREVGYTVTILNADGSRIDVPPSVTLGRRVVVRTDMRGHRLVRVRPAEGSDFSKRKVRQVAVELRYIDTEARLEFNDRVMLAGPDDIGTFEFDIADAAATGYEYRMLTTFTNNLTATSLWKTADDDHLAVTV